MNEPRKAGRPRKHLEEEHHFRTSDDATAAGAPPAAADSGQADASDEALASHSASAEFLKGWGDTAHAGIIDGELVESVVENLADTNQESPIEQKIHVMVEQHRVFLGEPQAVEISQYRIFWAHLQSGK